MLRLITVTPWSRINDHFLDGTVPYEVPDSDIRHPLMEQDTGAHTTQISGSFYRNIALDVVSESVFNYPYPYISEKTLRPIANQRMFVIMGSPGTLSALHARGFQTWHDIIDESYDSISDPCLRFKAVTEAVKKFCSLPLKDIKQYLLQNQSRLAHNLETLKNLREQELAILKDRLGA